LVRTGYYFVGWTDSPTVNTYFPGDPITLSAATVLYAQWAALQYTITYDINNGDTGTVPNSQSGYGTVTISSNSGGLGLTGQNFVGWNDQSDGNGNSYTPGASYALTSQNVYLYAIYAAPTPPAPPSNNPPAVTPTPEPKVETPTATGPTQPKLPAPIPVSPNQFVGKIATTAAPKQVVPNQIVPVKQKIEVQAPVESTIKEVLVNGKVVNATIAPTGEITLPVLVGPKDKIVVEEVAAGQTVEVPVVEANSPISLANVNFDFESANLTAAAKKILDKVVAVVKQHGFTSIDLSGHTDVLASGGFDNQLLSEHRAAAVRAYIKSKLAGSHVSIIIEGKAANEQLINKADAASRAVNRRVEIIVK
jgi:OOP family OmpA-OmpF porin